MLVVMGERCVLLTGLGDLDRYSDGMKNFIPFLLFFTFAFLFFFSPFYKGDSCWGVPGIGIERVFDTP
jgi:hypothetical protein